MSHLLDHNEEGIARFMAREGLRNKVWHRQGQEIPDGIQCIDTALEAARMTYNVLKSDVFADVNGQRVQIAGKCLVYRDEDGKQLGVNGSDFQVIQPREVFECVQEFIQGGELTIDTMGTMKEGKQIFMSLSVTGDPLEVVPGDMVERHLMALDGYDGNTPLTFASVATTPVCNNTVRAALAEAKGRGKGLVRKRHTKNVLRSDRVVAMREAMGIATHQFETFVEFGKSLAEVKMSDKDVQDFYSAIVMGDKGGTEPSEWTSQQRRKVAEMLCCYKEGDGQEIDGRKGTAWGAFNGVTAWTNHLVGVRKGEAERAHSVLFGSGDEVNSKAVHLLVNQYSLAA